MKGPTAAPRVTNDEIHDACSGVIGVSKGLSDKSTPESLANTGDDHVRAVPAIIWMKLAVTFLETYIIESLWNSCSESYINIYDSENIYELNILVYSFESKISNILTLFAFLVHVSIAILNHSYLVVKATNLEILKRNGYLYLKDVNLRFSIFWKKN